MHPDLMAQAAEHHRAELQRIAREERLARQAREKARADARARDRAAKSGKGPSDHDLAV